MPAITRHSIQCRRVDIRRYQPPPRKEARSVGVPPPLVAWASRPLSRERPAPAERGQDAHATAGGTPTLRLLSMGLVLNMSNKRATPPARRFQPRFGEVTIRDRGRLPHWESDGATYFVTFRLGDSLPQPVLESIRFERQDVLLTAQRQGREVTPTEMKRLDELFSERIESYLDAGSGACDLSKPEVADLVAGALQFFESTRYRQFAWSVMPNHVHAVFRPLPGWPLESILHSWKSFTSKEANKLLNRTGNFWEAEYFDHLIRSEEEFAHYIDYVASNPKKAGLKDWKWVWVAKVLV